jgi:hypothetical protein
VEPEGEDNAMKPKLAPCLLIVACALLAASGCIAQDNNKSASSAPYGAGDLSVSMIPTKNLPEGFSLLATQDASTKGVNMIDDISKFYGAKDIGPAKAVIGIYQWAPMGQGFDSKVTIISLKDASHAQAAIDNYKAQPRFQQPPYKGISRFGSAIINGHNSTEIRDSARQNSLRFLYLWNHENIVVLVDGNNDRSKSIELASATGL